MGDKTENRGRIEELELRVEALGRMVTALGDRVARLEGEVLPRDLPREPEITSSSPLEKPWGTVFTSGLGDAA